MSKKVSEVPLKSGVKSSEQIKTLPFITLVPEEEMKQSLNRRTDAELKTALTMVTDRMTEMENEDGNN